MERRNTMDGPFGKLKTRDSATDKFVKSNTFYHIEFSVGFDNGLTS